MILEGNVSVKAAILGGRRTVTKLMIYSVHQKKTNKELKGESS